MGVHVVATNRKAYHDYFIDEVFEAGMVLTGTEVKSLRQGKANLRDAYCRVKGGEVYVYNLHISPYEHGNRFNVEPLRNRKLLLHAREIDKLARFSDEKGLALIPTRIYFKNSYAKLEIGVARGKKLHDKRETMRRKEAEREMAKAVKER